MLNLSVFAAKPQRLRWQEACSRAPLTRGAWEIEYVTIQHPPLSVAELLLLPRTPISAAWVFQDNENSNRFPGKLLLLPRACCPLPSIGAQNTLRACANHTRRAPLAKKIPPALFALLARERPKPRAVVAFLGHGGRRHEEALPPALRAFYLLGNPATVTITCEVVG